MFALALSTIPFTVREHTVQNDGKLNYFSNAVLKISYRNNVSSECDIYFWEHFTLKPPPSQIMGSSRSNVKTTHLWKQEIYLPPNHEHVDLPASTLGKLILCTPFPQATYLAPAPNATNCHRSTLLYNGNKNNSSYNTKPPRFSDLAMYSFRTTDICHIRR